MNSGDTSVNSLRGENELRGATKTGRPWVDHEHLARLEKKTGGNLPKRKPLDSMK